MIYMFKINYNLIEEFIRPGQIIKSIGSKQQGKIPYEYRTRYLELTISQNLTSTREMAKERGYVKADGGSKINILSFDGTKFSSGLSDGYTLM
ncbi:MAG: hypothetical protein WCD89_23515 [Anaerocolumna sp.]